MTDEPSDNTSPPAPAAGSGSGSEPSALDDRKGQVLRAIVEEYVGRAQPVGSKRIAETGELGVSAATIRNDMGALERDGFIAQPHTSAGRIPTDLGYRYYVDHLAGDVPLAATARREVTDFFSRATRAMEELLNDTSQLLARLTDHAAVVVGPVADVERVRSVQLVALQPRLVLAVVVLSDGAVQKEAIALDHEPDDATLAVAGAHLDELWRDRTLAEVAPPEPDDRLAPEVVGLMQAIGHTVARRVLGTPGEPLYVGGASRLAAEHEAFTSAGIAARVLELLEQHVVMVGVMRELLGPGLTIRIGAENERDDLRECSIILAPYLVEGTTAGTIGVLGPTRMDYRQASAAVATVSARLGRQLTS